MSYSSVITATPNLRAYYRLGETSGSTAFDSSGNAFHGTYVGSPGRVSGLLADPDGAVHFNGVGQWITLPGTSITPAGSFTLECWASIEGFGSDGSSRILNGNLDMPILGYQQAEGTITSGAGSIDIDGAHADSGFVYGDARALDVLSVNQVAHLVYTLDTTAHIGRVYVNGILKVTNADTRVPYNSGGTFYIGRHYAVTVENMVGVVDEVAIYNRAITGAEVALHYHTGVGNSYAALVAGTTGISGWWRYGETSGTSAADSIGTNTGTLSAGVSFGGASALLNDVNGSANFNGTSTGLVAYGATGLTGDFSTEAWTFLTGPGSIGATDFSTIFGNAGAKRLLINNAFGYVLSQFGPNLQTPNGSFILNAWNHVVYTFDGVGTQKIYINAVEQASGTGAGASAFTGVFNIGSYANPASNYAFVGRIDEPAIYDVALSPATIAQHFSLGRTWFQTIGATSHASMAITRAVGKPTISTAAQTSASLLRGVRKSMVAIEGSLATSGRILHRSYPIHASTFATRNRTAMRTRSGRSGSYTRPNR